MLVRIDLRYRIASHAHRRCVGAVKQYEPWDSVGPVSSHSDLKPVLVSVVIPVGRVDEWLDIAVASALAQADVDMEVIAVFNNGAEVPADWPPLSDSRVRVLYDQKSLGPAGAGQWGIDEARGEFIACLDADDVMCTDRLRTQLAWLQSHPEAVLVSSCVEWIDETGRVTGQFELPAQNDVREQLIKLNVAPHSAWMMRASAVRTLGGYDLSMNEMEDYELLLRLGTLGSIAVLPATLTQYRLHPQQVSRKFRPSGHCIGMIARRRKALGRALGMSPTRVASARLWWEWQQWLMYLGRKVKR